MKFLHRHRYLDSWKTTKLYTRNIKILATSLSHILNSTSYWKFCTSRTNVMELSWLYWIKHLCKSSACHWWQVWGNRLYPHSPFVNKISCWGGKWPSKVFLVKKKGMFLFSFVSMILIRFDFPLSACSLRQAVSRYENLLTWQSCPLFPFILYLLLRWYDYWMRHRLHSDWESVKSSEMAVHVVRYWYGINKEITRGGQHINV